MSTGAQTSSLRIVCLEAISISIKHASASLSSWLVPNMNKLFTPTQWDHKWESLVDGVGVSWTLFIQETPGTYIGTLSFQMTSMFNKTPTSSLTNHTIGSKD